MVCNECLYFDNFNMLTYASLSLFCNQYAHMYMPMPCSSSNMLSINGFFVFGCVSGIFTFENLHLALETLFVGEMMCKNGH